MYNFLKMAAALAVLASLTTGCVNRATGSVNPSTDLSALKTMYVRYYPSDNSGVNLQIADKLRSKGVTVTTGNVMPAGHFDAIVSIDLPFPEFLTNQARFSGLFYQACT